MFREKREVEKKEKGGSQGVSPWKEKKKEKRGVPGGLPLEIHKLFLLKQEELIKNLIIKF